MQMAASGSGKIPGTGKVRFQSFAGFIVTAFVFAAFYLTRDSRPLLEVEDNATRLRNSFPSCNLFSGKWVYDNESFPLYKDRQCSFMADDFACEKFGRKDTQYQHWRWQPRQCDLPRFNGTALLEKLRGKRLVFVGDSLNKNQWISMLCLLESSLPASSNSTPVWKGSLITFKAIEYNATIDFYWEPLLVESNCDDAINHHVEDRIIRINSIENHARYWTDADMLVFNSFMWWLSPNMTLLWGSFESPDAIYKEGRRPRHYEMALRTWSYWLEFHINRNKTKLFFMSLSPYHKLADDWGAPADQSCYGETEPISDEGYWGRGSESGMMETAEAAIQELERRGLKIQYLNITQLSEYRKEAHPSIYRRHWMAPTEEQLSNPMSYSDCVHWCLPGVPDVWNQILYAYIKYS